MSELNNLRDKLDKAISNFKKSDKKTDISEYKAEYEQLLRITKYFSDLQHFIQKNENQLAELFLLKEAYERKITYELRRMKDNIFEELICYKECKTDHGRGFGVITNNVDHNRGCGVEICNVDHKRGFFLSNNKENGVDKTSDEGLDRLITEKYKILIENNLRLLDISIKNEMMFLEKFKESKAFLENDGMKIAGLDPALYKYYSSSDDLRSNMYNQQKEKGTNNNGADNDQSMCDNNAMAHSNKSVAGDESYSDDKDGACKPLDNTQYGDSKSLGFKSSETISEGKCTDITKAINEDEKKSDNLAIAKTMHNVSNIRQNNEDTNSVNVRISRIKDEIKNEEKTNQFNLETKHGVKEKIHILFRKLTLNKLELTERMLQKYEMESKRKDELENAKVTSEYDIKILEQKEKIKSWFLVFHKEFTKVESVPEIKDVRLEIDTLLTKLERNIIECKEKLVDLILSSVQAVLSQGSLESDIRFLEKMDKQLESIEKFDTPRFFKISVQFEIAKKYVKDIVFLKKKAFIDNFYNTN